MIRLPLTADSECPRCGGSGRYAEHTHEDETIGGVVLRSRIVDTSWHLCPCVRAEPVEEPRRWYHPCLTMMAGFSFPEGETCHECGEDEAATQRRIAKKRRDPR